MSKDVTMWVRITVPAKDEQEAKLKLQRVLDTDDIWAPRIYDSFLMDLMFGGKHL